MNVRRYILATGTVLLVLGMAGNAFAAKEPSPGKAKREITKLENRWLAHENDPKVLNKILANDFVHVLPSGFITKAEHMDYVREHPFPANVTRKFEEMRVRIYGTAGIVNGIVDMTTADGTTRRAAFTDVFAYRKGKWQAVNAQEMPLGSVTAHSAN